MGQVGYGCSLVATAWNGDWQGGGRRGGRRFIAVSCSFYNSSD